MTILTIHGSPLAARSTATAPFDAQRTSVPYKEADQTYCNGGCPLQGFETARALPIRTVESELQTAAVRD